MMSQEDKGLDVEMEDEGEFQLDCPEGKSLLLSFSVGRIVVDMDSMEVKSLKLSRKFCQLFGKDGLARADILRDIEGEIDRLRETSIEEYMDTIESHDKGGNNGI